MRNHLGITLNLLLKKEVIIKSIAACSIEIILWSFQSVKQFKTVVDALEIDSYQFYKGKVDLEKNEFLKNTDL